MKVYRYNEEKIFVGEEEALLNPLETKIQGKNVYLLPANATFEKPKLKENEIAIFEGGKWNYYKNILGKYYYENGLHEITDLKDKHLVLTDEEVAKINSGMTCEIKDGKYKVYFTEKQKAEKRIKELEYYLSSTDWLANRFADTGKEIPAEIKKARQDAREEISKLREIK